MYSHFKNSLRLQEIAKQISKTTMFVDIGCDHGKMLDYVLENKLANFVVGVDISEQSALKAKKLLTEKGHKNFSVVVSDGVDEFDEETISLIGTILISGLGGFEIKKILENLLSKINKKSSLHQLVLQPQNNAVLLRNFLIKNGFIITYDKMVKDKDKFYNIIKTTYKKGAKQKLTNLQLNYGVTNLIEKNQAFLEYLQQKYERLEHIINNTKSNKTKKNSKKQQAVIEKIIKELYGEK